MSCSGKWECLAQELEQVARVARAGVDAGAKCVREGCEARVNLATGYCVMGHDQQASEEQPDVLYPPELDALTCAVSNLVTRNPAWERDVRVQALTDFLEMDPTGRTREEVYRQGIATMRRVLSIFIGDSLPSATRDFWAPDPRIQAVQRLLEEVAPGSDFGRGGLPGPKGALLERELRRKAVQNYQQGEIGHRLADADEVVVVGGRHALTVYYRKDGFAYASIKHQGVAGGFSQQDVPSHKTGAWMRRVQRDALCKASLLCPSCGAMLVGPVCSECDWSERGISGAAEQLQELIRGVVGVEVEVQVDAYSSSPGWLLIRAGGLSEEELAGLRALGLPSAAGGFNLSPEERPLWIQEMLSRREKMRTLLHSGFPLSLEARGFNWDAALKEYADFARSVSKEQFLAGSFGSEGYALANITAYLQYSKVELRRAIASLRHHEQQACETNAWAVARKQAEERAFVEQILSFKKGEAVEGSGLAGLATFWHRSRQEFVEAPESFGQIVGETASWCRSHPDSSWFLFQPTSEEEQELAAYRILEGYESLEEAEEDAVWAERKGSGTLRHISHGGEIRPETIRYAVQLARQNPKANPFVSAIHVGWQRHVEPMYPGQVQDLLEPVLEETRGVELVVDVPDYLALHLSMDEGRLRMARRMPGQPPGKHWRETSWEELATEMNRVFEEGGPSATVEIGRAK